MFECLVCPAVFETSHQLGGHKGSHSRGYEYRERRNGKRNLCKRCEAPTKNAKFCSMACARLHKRDEISSRKYLAKNGDVLDVSNAYIAEYRQNYRECEICGREVLLCTDHDHELKKFRGLLCIVCNRQLGWYERNKRQIEEYLNKAR